MRSIVWNPRTNKKLQEWLLDTLQQSTSEKQFKEKLSETTLTPPIKAKKTTLFFHTMAYMKMKFFVQECTTEVAFHFKAYRTKAGYMITDVLMFPQHVSGANVESDEIEYPKWLDKQNVQELRGHGHSHVNMGVHPSGTDEHFQRNIANQMSRDDFYIFVIINKRNDIWVNIYEKRDGIVYETDDVIVKLMEGKGWSKELKDNIIKGGFSYGSEQIEGVF